MALGSTRQKPERVLGAPELRVVRRELGDGGRQLRIELDRPLEVLPRELVVRTRPPHRPREREVGAPELGDGRRVVREIGDDRVEGTRPGMERVGVGPPGRSAHQPEEVGVGLGGRREGPRGDDADGALVRPDRDQNLGREDPRQLREAFGPGRPGPSTRAWAVPSRTS